MRFSTPGDAKAVSAQLAQCPSNYFGLQQMEPLEIGASGLSVVTLQQRLKELKLDPGPIDGKFGGQTQLAVIQFQNSRGLLADGIVGAKTWEALSPAPIQARQVKAPSGIVFDIVDGATSNNARLKAFRPTESINQGLNLPRFYFAIQKFEELNQPLTQHFRLIEFISDGEISDGLEFPYYVPVAAIRLAQTVEHLREKLGHKALKLSSAYRSPFHPLYQADPDKASAHRFGTALDIIALNNQSSSLSTMKTINAAAFDQPPVTPSDRPSGGSTLGFEFTESLAEMGGSPDHSHLDMGYISGADELIHLGSLLL